MPETSEVRLFVAVKAFIVKDGRLLMLRESGQYMDGTNPAKYDLPGGRIEPHETLEAALTREVLEETGRTVASAQAFSVGEWWPKKHGEQWHIVGTYFAVKLADDAHITLSQDHDDYIWADLNAMPDAAIDKWKSVVTQHLPFLKSF